jgi:HNH endonuclease
MKEERKPFRHGYYEVSNLGVVYRLKPARSANQYGEMSGNGNTYAGKALTASPNKDGYYQVCTSYHGRQKVYFVACLVARKFIGPRPKGCNVHHKDHNTANNHLDNLEYKTHKEHLHHHIKHGRVMGAKGERNSHAKLNQDKAKEIRSIFSKGGYHKRSKTLAKKFKVHVSTIYDIVTNRRWKEAA